MKYINWVNENLMPDTDEIFAWIEHLSSFCHRRTGTRENRYAAEYIKYNLEEFGLQDVKIQHSDVLVYEPELWDFAVENEAIPSYFINYTLCDGKEGVYETDNELRQLVYVGDGTDEDFSGIDVKDKIVVANHRWQDCTREFMEENWGAAKSWWYDPKNTASEPGHVFQKESYQPVTFPYNYYHAMEKGAAGFVAVMWDNCDRYIHYCENYAFEFVEHPRYCKCANMKIPGVFISRSAGEKLISKLQNSSEPVMGKLKMRTVLRKAQTNLVSGILPGLSEETILVHSHHDAVFQGAVQDASGVSEVLALAKYFSNLPLEKRKRSMMFATTDTHYCNYVGHKAFIEYIKNEGIDLILVFGLEHIGKEVRENSNGEMALTGENGIRLMFVHENSHLLKLAKESTEHYQIEHTLILPINSNNGSCVSDSDDFKKAGYPVVSSMSPVMYLMDPMDTPDMVAKDLLIPIACATAEMIIRAFDISRYDLSEEPDLGYFD